MKSRKLFITIIILLSIISGSFFFFLTVQAKEAGYEIEVALPGAEGKKTFTLEEYIRYLYLAALSLVGIAALYALVRGGLIYMLSDTITSKDEAKKWIGGAFSGLVLALAASLILYTINPDLVSLKGPTIEPTEAVKTDEAESPVEEEEICGSMGAPCSDKNDCCSGLECTGGFCGSSGPY